MGNAEIKTIFWDNDGVLVDTEELYFQATREILASVDVTLTKEMFVELFMVQGRGGWHLAAERGVGEDEMRLLRERRNARYSTLLSDHSKVMDGVEDVLLRLSGKYLMGIVTSSHREHFEAIHRSSGLLRYFAFVLTREDYDKAKPDPEPYLRAVERAGFPKDACLVIEDTERGLAAATAAGLRCVIVPSPLTLQCRFDGAYRVLPDVRSLLTVLS